MGNRTAKFISALVGSIVAGAPLAAISQNAPTAPATASTATAESDCLASPKGTAPQGQHWHYRVERGTKRQCWYLRAEGAKATSTAQTTNNAPQPDSSPPQSVQNARAEYIAPQNSAAQTAPATAMAPQPTQAAPTTSSETQQPAVATRWPDTTAAASPAPQPAAAPATAADQPSAQPPESPAPVALASADAPADKPTGSLQMLLLVIGGALALAGLLASVIYRFAGGRARVVTADRRVNWDHRQDHDDSRAPWLNATPGPAPRRERPLPVDFDAVRPEAPQIAAFTDGIRRIAAQGRPLDIAATEPEIDYFDGEFEIETAAPLAADSHDQEAADHDLNAHQEHVREADAHEPHAHDDNAVDVDIFTAMLERLASEGPRLAQPSLDPSLEADLAALARSSRGRSAARA